MKKGLFAAVALGLAASAGDLSAQMGIPFSAEGRIDYAVPMGDFDDAAGEGVSVGAAASVGVAPGLGVYGSYSMTRFGAGLTSDETADAEDRGFSVGLTTSLPRFAGAAPWVGAGVVLHQLELGGEDEGIDEEMGFEVGGGVALSLSPNVRLTPGVGYRRYGTSIAGLLGDRELDVQYVTAGVGLNISF